jgi:DNA polymerase-3 subunit delta'
MNKSEIKLNWPILGNGHIVDFLAKSLAGNEVSGTYIFAGPSKLGKHTIANFFAYSLLCEKRGVAKSLPCGECPSCRQHLTVEMQKDEESLASIHADFHLLRRDKDKKNISVEQVREFIRILGMSSFLNSYKIGIIKNAESLSEEAANALLKTLEEPKERVVVILITADLEALPQTIVSRSQVLNFRPVKTDTIYDYLIKEHGVNRSQAKNLARLALGRPALAVKFLEDKEYYEKHLRRAEVFLSFFTSDLNARFAAIAEILGEKASGQEAARIAKRILEVWHGISRDLFLAGFGQEDLVQHEIVLPEITRQKLSPQALLNLDLSLRRAEAYLRANVNPKLVLEQVAMAI